MKYLKEVFGAEPAAPHCRHGQRQVQVPGAAGQRLQVAIFLSLP
jgi:hypothetical protein